MGYGVGSIPEWTIQQYADRHELGDLFVRQIMLIDSAYVGSKNENIGKQQDG